MNRIDATDAQTARPIMLLIPDAYNGGPTRLILYAHGYGEDQTALLSDPLKAETVQAFLNAGYILAGTNDAGWGTQASVDAYAGLDQWVRHNYSIAGVGIWSQSMGGLSGLLAITQNKVRGVVGWLGTYPVASLAAAYSGAGGSDFSAPINAAFGITGSGYGAYVNRTYAHDPLLKSADAFRGLPMRFYASRADTVVGMASHTDAFRSVIGAACESVLVECVGDHGDPSHFVPSEYVDFFDRCFMRQPSSPAPSNALGSLIVKDDGTLALVR